MTATPNGGTDADDHGSSRVGNRRDGVRVAGRRIEQLTVLGAGGHGRELAMFALRDTRSPAIRILDDGDPPTGPLARLGLSCDGPISNLIDSKGAYLVGIGTSAARRAVVERVAEFGIDAATYIDSEATVAADADVHEGVVIFPRSVVTTNTSIGPHTHLNVACAVQHDSEVGGFVQMSPGVLVNGDCRIGDGVFLGSGAIVTRGVVIGAGAVIGAGTVVLNDVPEGSRVLGVPGRSR